MLRQKSPKNICAVRLPLRGTLRVSPAMRRAELGPSLALEQSALARLSVCDARQPSRRGQVKTRAFLAADRRNKPRETADMCRAGFGSPVSYESKSFRLRRVTFVTAKVTKTMCAGRLPLRGSLRVSPDRRRAELGPSMALEQSALARLSGCDARQPSRRASQKHCVATADYVAISNAELRIYATPAVALPCAFNARRAAPHGAGQRSACSSAWMREFGPARAMPAAQGIGA